MTFFSTDKSSADNIAPPQCDATGAAGLCDGELSPASHRSAFYWQTFVQPFQVVARRTEVRNVVTEGWDIVPTDPESTATAEPVAKVKAKPSAELLAQRARKNATYRRKVATRVNAESNAGYSDHAQAAKTAKIKGRL